MYHKFNSRGYQLFLAGGCVRDALLGIEPKDFDLATDAKPDQVEQLFEKTIPVGKQFGIIRVIEQGNEFEVATFRKDSSYKDGRHPEAVEFTSAELDAQRRDFTVNALFFDLGKKQVIDFVGGAGDLDKKILKTVGDPDSRFQEDYLRVLRVFRFVSQLGFAIEPKTFQAAQKMSSQVTRVSRERIFQEFSKMFAGRHFSAATAYLGKSSLLVDLFSDLKDGHFLWTPSWTQEPENDHWFELMLQILLQSSFDLKRVTQAMESNRFPNDLKKEMLNGLDWWKGALLDGSQSTLGQKLEHLFLPGSLRGLLKKYQDTQDQDIKKVLEAWYGFKNLKPEPLVRAIDLKNKSGAELGQALKICYWIQLENPDFDQVQILMKARSQL
jgi:tRNA nucleotidyltransferase/poly(A) polymerase